VTQNKAVIRYVTWKEFEQICRCSDGAVKDKFVDSKFCIIQEFVQDSALYCCRLA